MKKKLLGLTFIVFLGVTMVSCSNDNVLNTISNPNSEITGISPAKASDISITSSGYVLASSKLTRAGSDAFSYHKYSDGDFPAQYVSNRPSAIPSDEKNQVQLYIKKNPNEAGVDFNYCNYFIQNIGSSNDNYTQIVDMNGAKHNVKGGEHMDYLTINGQHINDYNATSGPDALVLNLPVKDATYHDSYGDVNNTKENAYKIYKITYKGKVGYYLGFDYKTKKNDGETFDGDGVYNDWVVKLTPADGVTPDEPGDGGNTNPDPGNGGGTTNPDPGNVVTNNNGQIELNLSVNAEKTEGDYIATKLSIHVRDTSDVEVFIPVEAQYYCNADDMNIVLSHKLNVENYNSVADSKEITYQVNGNVVKLTVSYEPTGIRITTSGINAEILKYLRNEYGDGITFEIWNYFKSNIVDENGAVVETLDRAKLQGKLNTSNVKFTSDPGQYVNAFGALCDYDGSIYGKVDETTGVWTPYTDEALTTELGSQYWTRDAGDARYYIIKYHKNDLDCTVIPLNNAYGVKGTVLFNQVYKK